MIAYVVGLGSSGSRAAQHVVAGVRELAAHPMLRLRATSRLYGNPAVGTGTTAGFVNAAAVVDSALAPPALLRALFALEQRAGRLRMIFHGPRTLDLDVLLAFGARAAPLRFTDHPAIPHPRLTARAFAIVPAVEATEWAGFRATDELRRAALRVAGRASLFAIDDGGALQSACRPQRPGVALYTALPRVARAPSTRHGDEIDPPPPKNG